MASWVLIKTDEPKRGYYVARPGHPSTYTPKADFAQFYPTREAAAADSCPENERPALYSDR